MKNFIKHFKFLSIFIFLFLINSTLNKTFAVETIKFGIDNIDSYIDIFDNKKVGLVTNATGVNSSKESTIDILFKKTKLIAIFAPEHGIRSDSNEYFVDDDTDPKTGLPIFSLHGKTMKPTPEMLKNIDILVYDIQDVGARFFTYISTMKLCMEACKENNITFLVLDRPNPISCKIQGNILNYNFKSFVGTSNIPQRYGLTPGELANYFNTENKIKCKLIVVKMTNYDKNMYYDETGIDTWIKPSPAMYSINTAIVYPGTCIFEGTNLSEGRGTDKPFEYIGAPWINSEVLSKKLNEISIPGVSFKPIDFTPNKSKFKNELCHGIFIDVTDRKIFDPIKSAISLFYIVNEMYPENLKLNNMLNLLLGDNFLKEKKYTLNEIFEKFDSDSSKFEELVKKYRIY